MNRVEKNDRTALHLAAMFGSMEVLRALLKITEDAPKSFTQKKDEKLRRSRMLNVSPTEVGSFLKNGRKRLNVRTFSGVISIGND